MARHPITIVVLICFLAGLLAGCQADPMNGEIVQIGSTQAPFLGPLPRRIVTSPRQRARWFA